MKPTRYKSLHRPAPANPRAQKPTRNSRIDRASASSEPARDRAKKKRHRAEQCSTRDGLGGYIGGLSCFLFRLIDNLAVLLLILLHFGPSLIARNILSLRDGLCGPLAGFLTLSFIAS